MRGTARPSVGIIEGFFGRPWGVAERMALAGFLSSRGFEFYVYAPKAERYLRRDWREALPRATLEQLAELSRSYRRAGLLFGVGLTPFEIYLSYDTAAKAALKAKVGQLNSVGVDILCVLFDDMRGDIPRLAECQARIVSDISGWSDAQRCIVCPTYYSDDPILARAFGKAPPKYLQSLGQGLDPGVDVFWSGARVCSSSYTSRHLERVAERMGRKPFIWDNHLANDGRARCSKLYLDFWFQGWSIDPSRVAGMAVNPMCQPHLSRLPLASFGHSDSCCDDRFAATARSLCGTALGDAFVEDLAMFQSQGLSKLDASVLEKLADKYRRFEPDPYALEIGAWLRGEYDFDPSCLTE